MKTIIQEHLVSALQTFLATFLTTVGATILLADSIQWTASFWCSILLVGVRAGVKELFARFASPKLGGRI